MVFRAVDPRVSDSAMTTEERFAIILAKLEETNAQLHALTELSMPPPTSTLVADNEVCCSTVSTTSSKPATTSSASPTPFSPSGTPWGADHAAFIDSSKNVAAKHANCSTSGLYQEHQDVFPAAHLADSDDHERDVDSKLALVPSASATPSPTSTESMPPQKASMVVTADPWKHLDVSPTRCSTLGLCDAVRAPVSVMASPTTCLGSTLPHDVATSIQINQSKHLQTTHARCSMMFPNSHISADQVADIKLNIHPVPCVGVAWLCLNTSAGNTQNLFEVLSLSPCALSADDSQYTEQLLPRRLSILPCMFLSATANKGLGKFCYPTTKFACIGDYIEWHLPWPALPQVQLMVSPAKLQRTPWPTPFKDHAKGNKSELLSMSCLSFESNHKVVVVMSPWPPPQSNLMQFQLYVDFVLGCPVNECEMIFPHCEIDSECWKFWLELTGSAVHVHMHDSRVGINLFQSTEATLASHCTSNVSLISSSEPPSISELAVRKDSRYWMYALLLNIASTPLERYLDGSDATSALEAICIEIYKGKLLRNVQYSVCMYCLMAELIPEWLLFGNFDLQLLWDPSGFLHKFQVTPSQPWRIVFELQCRSNRATFQHVFCWCFQILVQLSDSHSNTMYRHGLFPTKDGVHPTSFNIRAKHVPWDPGGLEALHCCNLLGLWGNDIPISVLCEITLWRSIQDQGHGLSFLKVVVWLQEKLSGGLSTSLIKARVISWDPGGEQPFLAGSESLEFECLQNLEVRMTAMYYVLKRSRACAVSIPRKITVAYTQKGIYNAYIYLTSHGNASFTPINFDLELHPVIWEPGGLKFTDISGTAWGQAVFQGGEYVTDLNLMDYRLGRLNDWSSKWVALLNSSWPTKEARETNTEASESETASKDQTNEPGNRWRRAAARGELCSRLA